MDFLPLFHKLQDRLVLVVGGGEVAVRKARLLSDAGATLRVVAPEIRDELREMASARQGEVLLRDYQSADLHGVALIIAATDDEPLNAQISAEAQALGIPVNVVDAPKLCSVIFPAIVDRSPLIVAVTSGGDAPVLARLIRAKIETWIPATYGQLAGLSKRFRARVKALFPNVQQRRVFWEDVFQGQIAESVFAGKLHEGERLLEEKIAGAAPRQLGEVYLVGAGPGDPDLLTFRALRLMQQADVVLYDRLVAPAIVELCRRDAERIYVGKRRADHALPQEQINQRLVTLAKEGKRVLRLKGGDPFIFGRGGEEIEELGLGRRFSVGSERAVGRAIVEQYALLQQTSDHVNSIARGLFDATSRGAVRLPEGMRARIAEVARQGYDIFAALMEFAYNNGLPTALAAFEATGRAYLAFAIDETHLFQLTFGRQPSADEKTATESHWRDMEAKQTKLTFTKSKPPRPSIKSFPPRPSKNSV